MSARGQGKARVDPALVAEARTYTEALDREVSSLAEALVAAWRQVALGVEKGYPRALGLTDAEWVGARYGGLRPAFAQRQPADKHIGGASGTPEELEA